MFAAAAPAPQSSTPSWLQAERLAAEHMAKIVNAHPEEVVLMGGLTGNLHLMMASFYQPEHAVGGRNKILIEESSFSSDIVSSASQFFSR